MLIGLISDIHDQSQNLLAALEKLRQAGCNHLLFLGDMTSQSTFRTLRENWHGELDLVLGNCDYPASAFLRAAESWPHTRHHGEAAELELDGKRIFMAHDPSFALRVAAFASYDAVFFGHTHIAEQQMQGSTLLANPGDLQGRYGSPSYAIYDTKAHHLKHYSL